MTVRREDWQEVADAFEGFAMKMKLPARLREALSNTFSELTAEAKQKL